MNLRYFIVCACALNMMVTVFAHEERVSYFTEFTLKNPPTQNLTALRERVKSLVLSFNIPLLNVSMHSVT